jgi:hypothetical protein
MKPPSGNPTTEFSPIGSGARLRAGPYVPILPAYVATPASGEALLACFRPFIAHLASSSLSRKTIQKGGGFGE